MSRILTLALCILLLLVVLPVTAGQWDKETTVTFSQPVELPNVVLQPGTYVFRLLDSPGNRHVVEVFNKEETRLYATILAIPNYRLTPSDKTVMPFEERPQGVPEALHAWFYPGDNFGQEFVYPKARARELAKAFKQPVLAAEIEPNAMPEELFEIPVLTMTPEPNAIAKSFELSPPETTTWETPPEKVVAPEPIELPKTASPVPWLGLLGLSALALWLVLRVVGEKIV